jgi:hypothetical protein
MIRTEGTIMAITRVPFFVLLGASVVSVRFAIMIQTRNRSSSDRRCAREVSVLLRFGVMRIYSWSNV